MGSAKRQLINAMTIASTLGLAAGCSDVTLSVPPPPAAEPVVLDNRLDLSGEICTVDPGVLLFPYKILFIIDTSGSNATSDPQDQRAAAVQRVVEQFRENRSVSFAVMHFNTTPELLTAGFTREFASIVPGVIARLGQDNGSTIYVATLDMATQVLKDDMAGLPIAQRARTRYEVQWLSDGQPSPCDGQELPNVEAAVTRLMALKEEFGVRQLRFNTTQLTYGQSGDAQCAGVTQEQYLRAMAQVGTGTYQALKDQDLNFKIGFEELVEPFEHRTFFVVNESRVVKGDEILPDSDRDGIADVDEASREGYDPLHLDKDGDTCTDTVNNALIDNPGLCSSFCRDPNSVGGADSLDTDKDGLTNCAEEALGTNHQSADTDDDGFTDIFEIKHGTNPRDPKTQLLDSDLDGFGDAEEVTHGLGPRNEDKTEKNRFVYAPLSRTTSPKRGVTCHTFGVSNVQLVHTQKTDTSAEGDNLICLYMEQKPLNRPEDTSTFSRACKTVRYRKFDGSDVKEPADGQLSFSPADFKEIICPGGCN